MSNMSNLKEHSLAQPGSMFKTNLLSLVDKYLNQFIYSFICNIYALANFIVVDCGSDIVDLSTRELLDDGRLSEITESTGEFCGSTFIDAEFIRYLEKIVGSRAIDLLRTNHYGQMQYMVKEFCRGAKL